MSPEARPVRVCVIDDDPRIGDGLRLLLKSARGFDCVGCFREGPEALRRLPSLETDVVLMDINLGSTSGIDCVRQLKRTLPGVQVLMLTVYEDSEKIFQSLKAGASGYLLKRTPRDQLLQAIREVHGGGAPFSSHIARKVVRFFQEPPAAPGLETLTPRELEILERLSGGAMYKEIADQLGIALDTVRKHVRSVYEKLHVRSRSEAMLKYIQR